VSVPGRTLPLELWNWVSAIGNGLLYLYCARFESSRAWFFL